MAAAGATTTIIATANHATAWPTADVLASSAGTTHETDAADTTENACTATQHWYDGNDTRHGHECSDEHAGTSCDAATSAGPG